MKFVVGVMLCAFGTFWGAEGAGVTWPGSDLAILVLVLCTAASPHCWPRLFGIDRKRRCDRPVEGVREVLVRLLRW
jgi:hypothetical protein